MQLGMRPFLGTILIAVFAVQPGIRGQGRDDSVEKLIRDLRSSSALVRMNAAVDLTKYPEKVDQFARPLAELFMSTDEQVKRAAEGAFASIGARAVDSLEPLLTSEELNDFRFGCDAIRCIGDAAAKWKPLLLEKLASSDLQVRVAALHGLTGFSQGAPEAIDLIAEHLEHANFNVTLFACRLLIKTGPAAKSTVPALKRLLEDGVLSQRSYAAWTLAAVDPSEETLEILEDMIHRFYVVERERALIGVGLMGSKAKSLADQVREIMTVPGSNLEARGAFVLWQITGEPDDSVARLIELSQLVDSELSALQLLGEMGPAASAAAEFLAGRIKSSDGAIREGAITALGKMGQAAAPFRTEIASRLTDPDPLVRLAAAGALSELDEPAEPDSDG